MNIVEYFGFGLTLAIIGLGYDRLPDLSFVWGAIGIALLVVSARKGPFNMLVMLLVASVVIMLCDDRQVIPFLIGIGIPSFAMAYFLSEFGMFGKVLSCGFLGGILGFFVYWGYLILLGQHLSIHPVETGFANYFKLTMETLDTTSLGEYYASQGLTKAVLSKAFTSFLHNLSMIRPGLYIAESWLQILIGLVSARMILGSRGYLMQEPFHLQKMAWQIDYVLIAGLAAWLAGSQWTVSWLHYTGANIIFLIAPIAFYFGLSLLVYVFQRLDIKIWLIVALILLLVFMPLQVFFFIVIMGVFDPLIDYRDLDGRRGSAT